MCLLQAWLILGFWRSPQEAQYFLRGISTVPISTKPEVSLVHLLFPFLRQGASLSSPHLLAGTLNLWQTPASLASLTCFMGLHRGFTGTQIHRDRYKTNHPDSAGTVRSEPGPIPSQICPHQVSSRLSYTIPHLYTLLSCAH